MYKTNEGGHNGEEWIKERIDNHEKDVKENEK